MLRSLLPRLTRLPRLLPSRHIPRQLSHFRYLSSSSSTTSGRVSKAPSRSAKARHRERHWRDDPQTVSMRRRRKEGRALRKRRKAMENYQQEAEELVAMMQEAEKHDATRLLRKAAKKGEAQAQVELGMMHLTGLGQVDQDPALALKWFRRAGKQGHADAQFLAGGVLQRALVPDDCDLHEAAEWFRKGAEQGHLDCLHRLGMLQVGLGPGSVSDESSSARHDQAHELLNPAAGVEYLEEACAGGFQESRVQLAGLLAEGQVTEYDPGRARALLEESLDDPSACFALALMLMQEEGGDVDMPRARELLEQGAESSHQDSIRLLIHFLETGEGGPVDLDAAAAWRQELEHLEAEIEALKRGIVPGPADNLSDNDSDSDSDSP